MDAGASNTCHDADVGARMLKRSGACCFFPRCCCCCWVCYRRCVPYRPHFPDPPRSVYVRIFMLLLNAERSGMRYNLPTFSAWTM